MFNIFVAKEFTKFIISSKVNVKGPEVTVKDHIKYFSFVIYQYTTDPITLQKVLLMTWPFDLSMISDIFVTTEFDAITKFILSSTVKVKGYLKVKVMG